MDNKPDDKPQSTYKTPAGMQNLFGQVEQVKTIMLENMELINERAEKLEQLEDTTREMLGDAQSLAKSSAKKKNK